MKMKIPTRCLIISWGVKETDHAAEMRKGRSELLLEFYFFLISLGL